MARESLVIHFGLTYFTFRVIFTSTLDYLFDIGGDLGRMTELVKACEELGVKVEEESRKRSWSREVGGGGGFDETVTPVQL